MYKAPVSGAESEALGYRYARRHRLLRISQLMSILGEGGSVTRRNSVSLNRSPNCLSTACKAALLMTVGLQQRSDHRLCMQTDNQLPVKHYLTQSNNTITGI